MLRILLFSSRGAGTHYFGPGMSAYRLYSGIDKKEVSVSLAHGYKNQEETELFDGHYFISDLQGGGLGSGLKFYRKMKKWADEHAHRFDVVHCLGAFHASFLTAMAFERRGVPAFIKIAESRHTGFTKSSFVSTLLGLKRYRLKHANDITGYISISSEITEKLKQAGVYPEKIHSIPNGVDIDRFKPVDRWGKLKLRNELNLTDKFTVIFTGGFSERKNPLLTAESFLPFSGKKDIQLLLIGPDTDGGVQRKAIQQLIINNNVDNIIIANQVEDIEKYYQASDIFVLPSVEEGLSNAMLEAQACGLPALVTPVSGATDLIEEDCNGMFIDYSEDSITPAIEKYYRSGEKLSRHSREARKIIENSYSSKLVLKKHLELFTKEAGKPSSPADFFIK